MKICLINNLFKPYERGGAERIVDYIFENLKKRGAEVFLISSCPYGRNKTDETLGVYYLRSLFYNLSKIPIVVRFFLHLWDFVNFITLIKVWFILRKEKPDVVMTHNIKGLSFLIPFLIRKMGIKHVHTLHDIQLLHPSGLMFYKQETKIETFPAKIYQKICKFFMGGPDIVISPSKWLMNEFIKREFFVGSQKFVLPNPVPEFSDIEGPLKKSSNIFTFLYVGQIEEHKGVAFLTKAFVNFWSPFWTSNASEGDKVEIELKIVGPGSKVTEVGKMAFGDKRIKILGGKAHSEIKEIMKSADCLIVPSLCYENSPTVIYEAIFFGLPVIASRIGGIAEIIHKAGGILFEPGSEDDLISKMKYVLENKEEFEKIKNKEKNFKAKEYTEDLLKLL